MMMKQTNILTLLMTAMIGISGCGNNEKNPAQLPDLPVQPKTQSTQSLRIHTPTVSRQPAVTKFRMRSNINGLSSKSEELLKKQALNVRSLSAPQQPVRGLYVSSWVAGNSSRIGRLIHLIDTTDLNAMVIDVKNDDGQLSYRSSLPEVKAIGADRNVAIGDITGLLQKLKEKNIYVIGRIVTFKDPYYAKRYPATALQKRTGGVWRDGRGKAWLDPFRKQVRDYNIAIAAEAASLGFDEVQFDYVRFPDNGRKVEREVRFSDTQGKSKAQIIGTFLSDARRTVHAKGARISADVFGLVTSSENDMGIGQSWNSVASAVDVISPMTYPSHYSQGMYGVKQPDLNPYPIIKHAMADATHRNDLIRQGGNVTPASIRPWLQSFTAKWVHPHQSYGAEQVNKQVQAARDQGIREFLLWNANCHYNYRS